MFIVFLVSNHHLKTLFIFQCNSFSENKIITFPGSFVKMDQMIKFDFFVRVCNSQMNFYIVNIINLVQ